jgi:putative transcriptional regulator
VEQAEGAGRRVILHSMHSVSDFLGFAVWGADGTLERALCLSPQSINAIETGKFDPSLPVAFRLARLFNMTIEDIFADDE